MLAYPPTLTNIRKLMTAIIIVLLILPYGKKIHSCSARYSEL